ncbi:DUF4476 domain-containing protein [Taibaiella lutea]|nr:DUF4476 domain-containing protein [Taibaiella lutea]
MKKHILSILLLLAFSVNTLMAKDYAYIYIEGDKQTPFYVKLEGQMMPRLGKNYCILPNLDAGVTNIEILFQQNLFPPQKFVVKIPEGGSRGFLLKKINDRQFALYDMQQGFSLVSGNDINDDRLLPVNTAAVNVPPVTSSQVNTTETLPAFVPSAKTKSKKTKTDDAVNQAETPKERKFIPDMELNTAGGSIPPATVPVATVPVATRPGRTIEPDTDNRLAAADADEFEEDKKEAGNNTLVAPGIPNSDCKTAMSNDAFEDFATKILDQVTDDDKLKVLNKDKNRYCFTTEQVRIIANNLETQSGRYEVTKILFSRTSDQDNYPKLEALFKTNYLKEKFKEIINPK